MTSIAEIRSLARRGDERGWLVPVESEIDVAFAIQRVYWVYGTKPGVRRGLHAHHKCWQAAVSVAGGCTFLMDDGRRQTSVRLEDPGQMLLIPPMVWHEMFDFTEDCVLIVLADRPYDEHDYIRDQAQFRALSRG